MSQVLLLVFLALAGGTQGSNRALLEQKECTTVLEDAAAQPDKSIFSAAVKATGLDKQLGDPDLVATVFVPGDEAFKGFFAANGLTNKTFLAEENLEAAKEVLLNHVVLKQALKTSSLKDGQKLESLSNDTLTVDKSADTLKIVPSGGDAATVVYANAPVCKAMVQVVDTVLVPANVTFKSTSKLPSTTGSTSSSGSKAVDDCTTVVADAASQQDKSIFTAALKATGLDKVLGDKNLVATIFVPGDSAFEALFAQLGLTNKTFLAKENLESVKQVLLTHVVPKEALNTSSLTDGQNLTTLGNDTLTVGKSADALQITPSGGGAATVVYANAPVCKAMVQVVDTVLVPANVTWELTRKQEIAGQASTEECKTVLQDAESQADKSIFTAAVKATGLDADMGNQTFVATVFVPGDSAFKALFSQVGLTNETFLAKENLDSVKQLLLNHVVPNEAINTSSLTHGQKLTTLSNQTLTVDMSSPDTLKILPSSGTPATVVYANAPLCKAMVQVVDTVLVPAHITWELTAPPTEAPAGQANAGASCKTVLEDAASQPDKAIFTAAIKATGLDAQLGAPAQVATVFVPGNSAFEAFLAANGLTSDVFLAPDNLDAAKQVMMNHVVLGQAIPSTSLANGQVLMPLSGDSLTVDLSAPDTLKIVPTSGAAATVVYPNAPACSALIHVVDTVLVPAGSPYRPAGSSPTSVPAAEASGDGNSGQEGSWGPQPSWPVLDPASFSCPGTGIFAAGGCLTSFWSCDGAGTPPIQMNCPWGWAGETYFDPDTAQCNYKWFVEACPPGCGRCPSAGDSATGPCSPIYWSCEVKCAEPTEMCCPEGLIFNSASLACDYKENITGCAA